MGLACECYVCYHDTLRKKPHPDPIILAIEKLAVPRESIVSVGDDSRDIEASRRSGVVSAGVLWGSKDPERLIAAKPDNLLHNVYELSELIKQRYFYRDIEITKHKTNEEPSLIKKQCGWLVELVGAWFGHMSVKYTIFSNGNLAKANFTV